MAKAMTTMDVLRKSAQEVEIDHLLAEEFSCDPSFAERFVAACGLICPGLAVSKAIAEPSLGGEGFGDLLVEGTAGGLSVALLVEDKITASPAARQAQRYADHAQRLRSQGWSQVWSVLVAPASYRGERNRYDASVDLETVSTLLRSPDPVRQSYRRGIIERALEKKAASGVQIPDIALRQLKSACLDHASQWCAAEAFDLQFPILRESYYDGDSWIDPIHHSKLPSHVRLRHRLWTSVKETRGSIDLIVSPASVSEKIRFQERAPDGAVVAPYSDGKGIQVSISLPEMRQSNGFDAAVALKAFEIMRKLVNWYDISCSAHAPPAAP
jgi:hypothetical protein